MNSRQQLPARVLRSGFRRRWSERHAWDPSRGAGRYLYARRRGLRRFAGGLIVLVAALCVLAVVG